MKESLSIILPAKNEAANLPPVLAELTALYPTAEILVVDEPTTGQDWAGVSTMMGLIDELNAEGTTVVLVTHDLELAARQAILPAAVVVEAEMLFKQRAGVGMRLEHQGIGGIAVDPGGNRLLAVGVAVEIKDDAAQQAQGEARHHKGFDCIGLPPPGLRIETLAHAVLYAAGGGLAIASAKKLYPPA